MEEKNIRQILQQYLLGNAHEKDITAVDNWYNSFDSEELTALPGEEAGATKQEIWDRVESAMQAEKGLKPLPLPPQKTRTLLPYFKAAAMIILIAGAAGTFLYVKNKTASQNKALAYTTISTGTGKKKKITLQDGSVLTLNAGSTIRIQDDQSKDRKIELVDGEVFFEVAKDQQRPFVIVSENLTTTVLGTSFNISAYTALHNLSIGVVSGKVSIVNQSSIMSILEKDEELVYDKPNKSFKTIALEESLTAWQNGRLLLNDLSFTEMTVILKKNYGIDITTTDETIKGTRYTTELLTSMSPLQAVEVLAAIHNLKIKQKDNNIFLYQ